MHCTRREENFKKRQDGEPTRYCEPHIQEAWNTTNCGRDFVAALAAKGYRLAQGRKRLVVIDPHGKTHNPVRNLNGVRAGEFLARLRDLDFDRIPDASVAFSKARETSPKQKKGRWSARQMAQLKTEMEEKHRREYDTAHVQHARKLHSAKKTLAAYYDLPEKKKTLIQLKDRIEQAPWWKRLLGLSRKDQGIFREQVTAYNSTLAQYREKITRIKDDGLNGLSDLQQRQSKERMSLKLHLDWQNANAATKPRARGNEKTSALHRPSQKSGRDRQGGR